MEQKNWRLAHIAHKNMKLTRSTKLTLNTITSLVNQVVVIICGFILPRMFLVLYNRR